MSILTGARGLQAEINVTPMIDVLLVLLVIFMVVKAPNSTGLDAQVPQPADSAAPPPLVETDIVITVRSESIQINRETIAPENLPARLGRIFKLRSNAVMFIRAEKDLEFGAVAHIVDIAKGAGVNRVALMGAI